MIEAFLHALQYERGLSPQTCTTYRYSLNQAQRYFHGELEQQKANALQSYLNHQRRKRIAPITLNRHRAALRTYFSWLKQTRQRLDNPAMALQIPKIRKKTLPKTLSVDEITILLAPPNSKEPLTLRNHALFELAYSAGLRLAELIAINWRDCARLPDELIITGKGGYQRRIFIGTHAKMALSKWLNVRAQIAAPEEKALFVSNQGRRIHPRSVEYILHHYAQSRLPNRHITPHMLRHSFAGHMLQACGDIRAVQDLLGHQRISTTQIYTFLDFQQLSKVYDRAHPRAQKNHASNGANDPKIK